MGNGSETLDFQLLRPKYGLALSLVLDGRKAVYVPESGVLILADLHLGKATHFRMNGIAVPGAVDDENWDRLADLMRDYPFSTVVFLGDLFHSAYNPQWENFHQLRSEFGTQRFILVQGNHDILGAHQYDKYGIEIRESYQIAETLLLTHEPREQAGCFNVAGHLHPGIRLSGKARQSLRLPCFLFGAEMGLLPAFGLFTGLQIVETEEGDDCLAVAEGRLFAVSNYSIKNGL